MDLFGLILYTTKQEIDPQDNNFENELLLNGILVVHINPFNMASSEVNLSINRQ